jgi:hypothetical protein
MARAGKARAPEKQEWPEVEETAWLVPQVASFIQPESG